ncbi:MAG: DUF2723 domain-containing protein [Anaerolineae bacterium]|nr:DUF2723 domain-containing protein [Anaerolineae bacterium]
MQRKNQLRIIIWVAFFMLYAATTAQDILPADNGEFQLAAARWAVLHPPGYPLYTLIGALWVRLVMVGSLAFRLNLLSAALAATTLLLLFETIKAWAQRIGTPNHAAYIGGLVGILALSAAPTFWAQATTANIRMPTLLFTVWGYLALSQFRENRPESQDKALRQLALIAGLGVGHHPSLVFVAIGWGIYVLIVAPRIMLQPQRWWKAILIGALTWTLPQLYLPIRGSMADVPLDPGGLNTWNGFWHHVLARGFTGDMFAFANAADLALRLPLIPTLFKLQFPVWLLLATFISWLWTLRRSPKPATALLISWSIHTFVTITYRAPQTVEYLMPAYAPIAIALGIGSSYLAQCIATILKDTTPSGTTTYSGATHLRKYVAPFIIPGFILLLLVRLPLRSPDFLVQSVDTSVRDRVAPLLETAPPDSLLLADWRWATPLWVLQQVEGRRPDVTVFYVYPQENKDYDQVWYEHVEAAGGRPVLTTHFYNWPGWTFAPVGGGYRLFKTPLTTLASELPFEHYQADLGIIRLLGYQFVTNHQTLTSDTVALLKPGSTVELRLVWQATGSQDPAPSITARLWDSNGGLLTQSDQYLGNETADGEIKFTTLTFQLPGDRCDPVVRPSVGVYTVQDGNFENLGETTLPNLPVTCDFPNLPPQHVHPGIVLGKGPLLKGISYNVNGESAIAYLHWCGPGKGLIIKSGDTQAVVHPLQPGKCQTIRLPIAINTRPEITLTRLDGAPVSLLTAPFPIPQPEERYIPFGDELVLVESELVQRRTNTVVNLKWNSLRPLTEDYAVSVRLLREDGSWLGVHDYQPALSDIPTLKWVVQNAEILDPHPFTQIEEHPHTISVTVYERFRISPLPTMDGPLVTFTAGE